VGALIEPAFGILADTGRRRIFVLGGAVSFFIALLATGLASGFAPLLVAFSLMWLASGAFVSLSEATLMDVEPGRQEQNMARWTLAGSVGVVAGPLVLAGAVAAQLGWRGVFVALAAVLVPLGLATRRTEHPASEPQSIRAVVAAARMALTRLSVLRWLVLLELTDLMGDVLTGFLALYLVDVGGLSPVGAALGVGVWSAAGLAGDALLLPVLSRMPGVRYLRFSAVAALAIYPAFLLATPVAVRLGLIALLGVTHAGWYAVPKARLFGELPGKSGVVVALTSVSSALGYLSPLVIGLVAEGFGLPVAMWIPLVAPLALLVGLRGAGRSSEN
jgi:FSR family fosmidomycin resistance protein-like MFS transporter